MPPLGGLLTFVRVYRPEVNWAAHILPDLLPPVKILNLI
jgi:hypothetical protein